MSMKLQTIRKWVDNSTEGVFTVRGRECSFSYKTKRFGQVLLVYVYVEACVKKWVHIANVVDGRFILKQDSSRRNMKVYVLDYLFWCLEREVHPNALKLEKGRVL